MSDYISREAVLLHLNDIWLSTAPTDTMYDDDRQLAMVRCMGLNDAMDVVKDAPAADVRPVKRGKWELDSAPGEPWRYVCNICGEKTKDTVMGKPRANFCHHCGADMRPVPSLDPAPKVVYDDPMTDAMLSER